jgi:hypothetical protein
MQKVQQRMQKVQQKMLNAMPTHQTVPQIKQKELQTALKPQLHELARMDDPTQNKN